MTAIISFMKNFFVLVLILFVFSYLVPKESYRKYLQFFIGIFMAVILLEPVAEWIIRDDEHVVYENLEEITNRLEQIQYNEENGEDIFELFYMDSETK